MKYFKRNITESMDFDDNYNVHASFGDEDFMEVRMPLSKWRDKDGGRLERKMREIGYSLYDVGQCDGGAFVVATFKKVNGMGKLDESISRAIRKILG